jgi:hypothetical protein
MLRFHLVGDWPPGRVVCTDAPSSFALPSEVRGRIDRDWERITRELPGHLFDGPMCRLERFEARGDTLHLALSRTSYKYHYGTNILEPQLAERFGEQALARPLGVSCALVTSDGVLLMGRRNENVAYYPSRVHPFAGAVEPAERVDIFDEVRRELHEELHLDAGELADMRCVGVVEDWLLRHPELIVLVRCRPTRGQLDRQVDAKEHHDSFAVEPTRTAIDEAVGNRLLTPVAVATVMLWGKRVLGDSWFQGARPRVESAPKE